MKSKPITPTSKPQTLNTPLDNAHDLAEAGELDAAYKLADKALKQDPNNADWLNVMTYIMLSSHKPTLAYNMAKRVIQLAPKNAAGWLNLGMAANDMWRSEEALRCNLRGLKYSTNDKQISMLCVNAASVLIDTGKFKEAEKYCRRALEHNPDSEKAVANLGFCELAQRKWQDGWKHYHKTIGCEWRPRQDYGGEPEWDGKGKGTIVIWADQGLGDVISAASMIPDLIKWANENDSRIILDVDRRLEGLFKRSFPEATVYGTRGKNALQWAAEDREIHYSLPIMQLGEFFRNKDEDFPGTPYLVPDPDRVMQWKALFDAKKRPAIGLAWSGGIERTGARYRKVGLDKLKPVIDAVDAHWVSLQYLPAHKEIEGTPVVEYKHGTLTQDYDDTVAMVAALDHVFAVHTTVIHVAGALGIPCWTLVPNNSQWRYGQGCEDYVWAKSVRLIRQQRPGQWGNEIKEAAGELSALYEGIPETAGKATRDRAVRGNGAEVRPDGQRDHRQAGNRLTA